MVLNIKGRGLLWGPGRGFEVRGFRGSGFREFKSSGLQVVRCKVYMWLQDLNFVAQGSGVLLLKPG